MPTLEAVNLVNHWFESVFTRGDADAVDELLAQDVILNSQGHGKSFQGADKYKNWLRWYCSSFTDREWTVKDIIAEGDKVVARYSGYVTYQGGLLGIPGNGQRIQETGILIFRVVDGMIHELWCEMSDLQLVQQLGALPQ